MNSLGKINGNEVFEEDGFFYEDASQIGRIDPFDDDPYRDFFERYE